MDVKSIASDRGAGGAETFLLLFLATVVITPAKLIKFVDDVLVEYCDQHPCGDGLNQVVLSSIHLPERIIASSDSPAQPLLFAGGTSALIAGAGPGRSRW